MKTISITLKIGLSLPSPGGEGGARSATDEVARCYAHLAFPSGAKQSSGLFRGPLQRWMRFSAVTLASTIILHEPSQAGETYKKLSRMINKVRKISEYAIIIIVFCEITVLYQTFHFFHIIHEFANCPNARLFFLRICLNISTWNNEDDFLSLHFVHLGRGNSLLHRAKILVFIA